MLQTFQTWLSWLGQFLWELIKPHFSFAAIAAALFAVGRMFGTIVETGWRGVLFRFGRVHKELKPGLHLLVPIVDHVRKVRIRSVSVNLPTQRIVSHDGLVYDVQVSVVYHVRHPASAMVQINDVHRGCQVLIPLTVAKLIAGQTSDRLADRLQLDQDLASALQTRFDRWGLVVEQAGFKSIAPTRETLRLTQFALRCKERQRLYGVLLHGGASPHNAVTLLNVPTRLIERSAARYRGYRRHSTASRKLAQATASANESEFEVGDRIWANWWELGEYYPGVVTKRAGKVVHIKYDDGDEEKADIRNVQRQKPAD